MGAKGHHRNEAQDDSVKMKHLSQKDCLKDAIDLPPFSLDGQRSELFFLERGG